MLVNRLIMFILIFFACLNSSLAKETACVMQQKGGDLGAVFMVISKSGFRLDTSFGSMVSNIHDQNNYVYNMQSKVYCNARGKIFTRRLSDLKPSSVGSKHNYKFMSWKKIGHAKICGLNTNCYEYRGQKALSKDNIEVLVIKVWYATDIILPKNINSIFPLTEEFGHKEGLPLKVQKKYIDKDLNGQILSINKKDEWSTSKVETAMIDPRKEYKVPANFKQVANEYNVILGNSNMLEESMK